MLRWFGHFERMDDERMTRRVYDRFGSKGGTLQRETNLAMDGWSERNFEL